MAQEESTSRRTWTIAAFPTRQRAKLLPWVTQLLCEGLV